MNIDGKIINDPKDPRLRVSLIFKTTKLTFPFTADAYIIYNSNTNISVPVVGIPIGTKIIFRRQHEESV
jgi:hypothetical protein